MANWKIFPDPAEDNKIEYTSFLQGRKFFAVDDSGSTAGAILRQERAFVDSIHGSFPNPADAVSLWGSRCDKPTQNFESAQWGSRHGGTQPSGILENPSALDTIKSSDVWFLLTDGQVWDGEVHRLAELAQQYDILNVPLAFIITGSRRSTPSTTDISVGISFFASSQDTLILFKETSTGKIYVIAAKGCFSSLSKSAAAQNLETWDEMPVFKSEAAFFTHCKGLDIQIAKAESRAGAGKGMSLGAEWEERHGGAVQVDLDLLPNAGLLTDEDLFSLLADEAFDTLAVAYKTRSRIAELRAFVQRQKVEQVAPKLEDLAGAGAIISKMGDAATTEEQRKVLQEQLREAHAKNREHYRETVANFAGSPEEQGIRKRNQLVDAALRSLASIETASFNAEILSRKSNRARRAEVVSSVPAIDIAKLDLEAPSCKGFCLVCCGDDEIMSICFKEPEPDNAEDNTTDFALNFPLAAGASAKNVNLVSSQNVCFQCALLGPQGMSIYKELLTAILPAVQYDGSNKKYINDQLYMALTARLATGAAGIGQLFMAILQETLRTKPWAGAGLDEAQMSTDEQLEALQRRKTFQWMLNQVVQHTRTREDFKETGAWVSFPQALSWVAEDFRNNGLASFAVTYPVAGFENLLALGRSTGEFSNAQVYRLKSAKTVYSVAAKFLSDLQTALNGRSIDGIGFDEQWKQKYFGVLYQDFNGPLVPQDRGTDSLVKAASTFHERLSVCIGHTEGWSATFNEGVMRKVQLIIFWLLFKQSSHCTAQTFFTRIRDSEPLAAAVLDPILNVPGYEHRNILLSIFAEQEAELIDRTAAAAHCSLIPFANPFGASVLHCGAETCHESFCAFRDPKEVRANNVHTVREARTRHLIKVFGICGRFEASTTGLPERPHAGQPPTSIHTNLHITIAREWAARSHEQRRAIMAHDDAREAFVASVRGRLCANGRGNLFQSGLDDDTKVLLPSFFSVLKKALEREGKSGEDISVYEHDFKLNKMELKVRWELESRQ
ncbi:Nn.00g113700.m01.CDS01 [Neocucurbitaria sp. VM-36]